MVCVYIVCIECEWRVLCVMKRLTRFSSLLTLSQQKMDLPKTCPKKVKQSVIYTHKAIRIRIFFLLLVAT